MNKVLSMIIMLLSLNLVGCTMSYSDIHKSISDDYKDITIETYLETGVMNLSYSKDMIANLILFQGYYVIDFNHEITYFYDINHKTIIKYTSTVDTAYHIEAESIIEFIQEVEKSEAIKFEKLNYLIFDVIRSALEENQKPYIQFNENRANKGFYHPYLVIKKENYKHINKLQEIFEDMNDEPQEVKIIMDKHTNSSIIIYPYGIDISSHDNDVLIIHITNIIKNIQDS